MPTGSSIDKNNLAERFLAIKTAIKRACDDVSRPVEDITLVAVSKGHAWPLIKALFDLGQRDFGESYAQEFITKKKQAEIDGLKNIKWHFIGGIQSNKIKIIKEADVIHSVSALKHAEILNAISEKNIEIFLQVNLDADPTRQGFLEEEIAKSIIKISGLTKLKLQGLMTILPITKEHPPAYWFQRMCALRRSIIDQGLLAEVRLSMGMSDDFVEAIAHGANFLRIGTKIFGAR